MVNARLAAVLQLGGIKRFCERLVRRVLDFPMFYKILVANTALVVAAIALGVWLGSGQASVLGNPATRWGFGLWLGSATLLAIVVVNYALLRAALRPVSTLTRLVLALRRGEMKARAERPIFGDSDSIRLIQTANNLLDELEAYRNRVNDLSQRMTQQLETERSNIARELHDETAQNLATLLVLEQMIAQARDDGERAHTLEDTRQLTRLTLEGVRRMSIGLQPAALEDLGVAGALQWYVEEVVGSVLPEITLDLDRSLDRLSPQSELALYRIAQEALSNVARHAHARKVTVSLKREADKVVLRISDDGVGFGPDLLALQRRDHLGLFTIRERARLAGGEADITSEPGKGTTVMARFPLQSKLSDLKESR